MQTRWLFGSASVVLLVCASAASAEPPSIRLADSNAECDGPGHIPVVEVEGIARGRYGSVKTRELWACIAMNTGSGLPGNRGPLESSVKVEATSKSANTSSGWRYYTMPFAYIGPLSEGATYRKDPVEMCNALAASKSGEARRRFIKNGDYILAEKAYRVVGRTTWKMRRSNNPFHPDFHRVRHEPFERESRINAQIRCLPTDNFAATSTNTSTNSDLPPGTVPTTPSSNRPNRANPDPRRTNPPPTVKRLSLTAAPANIEQVGRWKCPTAVRLRGRVNVRRAFDGKAIFVGSQWLSPATDLSFGSEGGRYVVASYPLDWPAGGLTASSPSAPRKQLSFTFNVSDEDGELQRSRRKNVTVTCQRNG